MDDASGLIDELNELLRALSLPIALETPIDLTPSLLLAILECILQSRLPISQAVRAARDRRVDTMKIFLGVLEGDIIKSDVGLSEIDPRKLAAGEWDEVVYVGQLLCWLGKKRGLIRDSKQKQSSPSYGLSRSHEALPDLPLPHLRALSPSTRTTATSSPHTTFSLHSPPGESMTTVASGPSSLERTPSLETEPPRCIHEIDEPPSFTLGTPANESHLGDRFRAPAEPIDPPTFCRCPPGPSASSSRTRTPVRYDGWIERADEESELASYEASRSPPRSTGRPAGVSTPQVRACLAVIRLR